jgi:hypothetical protein
MPAALNISPLAFGAFQFLHHIRPERGASFPGSKLRPVTSGLKINGNDLRRLIRFARLW